MGNRTFGKGSVQSVLPLGTDAGIKLTTALYYTPEGRSIQVTGVDPDIFVDDTAQGNMFRIPREADLQRHIHNAELEDESAQTLTDEYIDEPKMFEFGGDEDFQLAQAINFLEGRPVKKSDPSLAQANTDESSADAEATKSNAEAQKKSPISSGAVERYRITPEGLVPVNEQP